MKTIDAFEFLPTKADTSDTDHDRWIDVLSTDWGSTGYGYELTNVFVTSYSTSGSEAPEPMLLPAVQSARDAGPSAQSGHTPNNDWAMDLIDWALDQIA